MTKHTYRLGGGQFIVLLATLVAVAGGVAWILLEIGVLPALNRFL